MRWLLSTLLAAGLALSGGAALAQKHYGPGVSDSEIRIGQTMPYSGPASAYGVSGRAQIAYFRMLNEQGGINGRKIRFLSLDDGYSPPKTVEQTRRLVEEDQVLAIMGSLGTAANTAIAKYLNAKKVPHLFIASGASKWNDAQHFPWTMPLVPLYRTEGKIYGKHILDTNPNARIAVLYQNDDLGKDYVDGLKDALGAKAAQMLVAVASYEVSDPTIDSQIVAFKASGADTMVDTGSPKFTAQAIRKVYDIGWRPAHYISQTSSSPSAVLQPAGPDKAIGVMTATATKSVSDRQWAADPGYVAWLAFMRSYFPEGDTADQLAFAGYSNAHVFAEVLRRCGDQLTRERLLEVATHLDDGVAMPNLLPGTGLSTSPTDYNPIKQFRLQRWDGQQWVLFSGLIS